MVFYAIGSCWCSRSTVAIQQTIQSTHWKENDFSSEMTLCIIHRSGADAHPWKWRKTQSSSLYLFWPSSTQIWHPAQAVGLESCRYTDWARWQPESDIIQQAGIPSPFPLLERYRAVKRELSQCPQSENCAIFKQSTKLARFPSFPVCNRVFQTSKGTSLSRTKLRIN